jgi:hypothetical protein
LSVIILQNENTNVVRNCFENGTWDSLQSGECVENFCEFIENAKVIYETTRQGEVAIGTCVKGFEVFFSIPISKLWKENVNLKQMEILKKLIIVASG